MLHPIQKRLGYGYEKSIFFYISFYNSISKFISVAESGPGSGSKNPAWNSPGPAWLKIAGLRKPGLRNYWLKFRDTTIREVHDSDDSKGIFQPLLI